PLKGTRRTFVELPQKSTDRVVLQHLDFDAGKLVIVLADPRATFYLLHRLSIVGLGRGVWTRHKINHDHGVAVEELALDQMERVHPSHIVERVLLFAAPFFFATQPLLAVLSALLLALPEVAQNFLPVLPVFLLEIAGIARLPVNFNQATICVLGIDAWIDFIELYQPRREIAALGELDIDPALMKCVLAQQLAVGFQMCADLQQKWLSIR